jgi:hypothetical protein
MRRILTSLVTALMFLGVSVVVAQAQNDPQIGVIKAFWASPSC